MSDNVSNLVTQMVTNLNASSQNLQENIQQLQDMQVSSNTFNDFLKEAIKESTDNLNGQIKLDDAMQEELSRVMKIMLTD